MGAAGGTGRGGLTLRAGFVIFWGNDRRGGRGKDFSRRR